MKEIWTRHLQDPVAKERFRDSISRLTVERMHDIVTEMEKDLDRAELNPKNYEIPNWDYRQAHNNGYRQCLSLMKSLLTLDQKETTPNERKSPV